MWQVEPTEKWQLFCNQLGDHPPTPVTLTVRNMQRKWELVSAYQKCIRRGLKEEALRLVTGFLSFDSSDWRYFWRRICTTACEDVGYADPELMNFVIACSMTCTAKTLAPEDLLRVWLFVTTRMCDTTRSRIYCQLSLIEEFTKKGLTPCDLLEDWEKDIATALTAAPISSDPKTLWAFKNNWRGEAMLKFQTYDLNLRPIASEEPERSYEMLFGLPDFTYDMHTRIGRTACIWMCGSFKRFFNEHPVCRGENNDKALGWALFYVEGGYIKGGLSDPRLSEVEMKFVASKFGWHVEVWRALLEMVREYIYERRKLNQIRMTILQHQGYFDEEQENCCLNANGCEWTAL
jgi:hypothetical protein